MKTIPNYPLSVSRDHKLYELDGTNVPLITGLSWRELRMFASAMGDDEKEQKFKNGQYIPESMAAPYWFKVLEAKAQFVWKWRHDHNLSVINFDIGVWL